MNLKSIPLFLGLAALSGCSTYSETFDCPPGRGVGCKSLSKINRMVEEGQLPLEERSDQDHPARTLPVKESLKDLDPKNQDSKTLKSKKSHNWIETKDDHQPINLLNQESLFVESPKTRLKIWVAGYEDEEGNTHAPSYVYASLQKEPNETRLKETSLSE